MMIMIDIDKEVMSILMYVVLTNFFVYYCSCSDYSSSGSRSSSGSNSNGDGDGSSDG